MLKDFIYNFAGKTMQDKYATRHYGAAMFLIRSNSKDNRRMFPLRLSTVTKECTWNVLWKAMPATKMIVANKAFLKTSQLLRRDPKGVQSAYYIHAVVLVIKRVLFKLLQ